MVMKEFSLDGKVAIVTGAGRGLGRVIALTMAEAGADIVCAGRTFAPLEATVRDVQGLGRTAQAVLTDVTRADQVEAMVRSALDAFGQIDVLVNNAGFLIAKPVVSLPDLTGGRLPGFGFVNEAITAEEWRSVVDANLLGPFLCCQAVGPHMLERRSGKVVNVTSVAAGRGYPYIASYGASKAALANFTRSLALEWAPYNININAIGPANFPTRMNAPLHQEEGALEQTLSRIPLGRLGDLRHVGLLAVYLACEASSYMTGQSIYIDGGVLV